MDSVCVKTYLTRHEAELDRALLESCQVDAWVSADDGGGMQPHLLFGNRGARLMAPQDRAAEAAAILASTETDPDAPAEP